MLDSQTALLDLVEDSAGHSTQPYHSTANRIRESIIKVTKINPFYKHSTGGSDLAFMLTCLPTANSSEAASHIDFNIVARVH